jgi:hypothetical protein
MRTRSLISAAAFAAASTVAFASPAAAQPGQEGLVNVNITDVAVQVPIGVAANVCDVNVAVLVQDLVDDSAQCDANATPEAEITPAAGGGGGPVQQSGLVNLNLEDIAVQVPIGIAANICDVNVAVLVSVLGDNASPCTATADSLATITPAA